VEDGKVSQETIKINHAQWAMSKPNEVRSRQKAQEVSHVKDKRTRKLEMT
jgi:hypothetical protein